LKWLSGIVGITWINPGDIRNSPIGGYPKTRKIRAILFGRNSNPPRAPDLNRSGSLPIPTFREDLKKGPGTSRPVAAFVGRA
jgi:hypothetical protein